MTAPQPYWSDARITLYLGDCRDVLPSFAPESVDAVVCDPPYDLTANKKGGSGPASLNPDSPAGRSRIGTGGGFMGRDWDATGVAFDPATWHAVLRVLKPGAHVLAFGGPRTFHRLTCAIEDAGFEIRDPIADLTGISGPGLLWISGQGMPKSLDVSKAIDKALGAEREVIAEGVPVKRMIPGADQNRTGSWIKDNGREFVPAITKPATEQAAQWDGWGTGLRPSWEPIVVARKPLTGTVVQNVLTHSTGAINIDACRIPVADADYARNASGDRGHAGNRSRAMDFAMTAGRASDVGRWPPNLVLAHSPSCQLLGTRQIKAITGTAAGKMAGKNADVYGQYGGSDRAHEPTGYADTDGMETVEAWNCIPGCPVAEMDRQSGALTSGANPSRRSPDKVCDAYGEFAGQPECTPHRGADSGGASRFFPVFRYQAKAGQDERPRLADGTAHPTVKPVELMRWLVRLVTPRGGLALDPFAGSGTTAEACIIEGFRCVLIDKDPTAVALIRKRLSKDIQPDIFGGGAA